MSSPTPVGSKTVPMDGDLLRSLARGTRRPDADDLNRTYVMPSVSPVPAHLDRTHVMPSVSPMPSVPLRRVQPSPMPAPMPALRACAPTADARLVMTANPEGKQAAAFRVLRDSLLAKGMPRVVAVSSAAEGDGATTCAMNLALALAERPNEKVLLLDGKFSQPEIADILGVDDASADPAAERSWTAPFVVSALTQQCHVATLPRRQNAPAYVDMAALGRAFDAFFRMGYRYIVIDMAPVDSTPESKTLAHLANAVLFAARAGHTSGNALRRAVERLDEGKAIGVALVDAPV